MNSSILKLPAEWTLGGSHPQEYDFGDLGQLNYSSIKSIVFPTRGYGTLVHSLKADAYRGMEIRLTGRLKAEDIRGFAGLWIRTSGKGSRGTRFDNLQNRPEAEDGFRLCECTLEVVDQATHISFGALLHGAGQVWIGDVSYSVAGLAHL